MALKSKAQEQKQEAAKYDVKVTRAKDFTKDGKTCVAIDMEVNGVTIYGSYYRCGTDKNGKEYSMVSFPSKKSGEKYYNHAYFPISEEVMDSIEKQIDQLIG